MDTLIIRNKIIIGKISNVFYIVALPDLKKLKLSVENLHSEKVKLEKQNAKKPAGKAKGKVTLKKESDVSIKNFKLYIKFLNIFLYFFIQGY